jgi:hypothetical protein
MKAPTAPKIPGLPKPAPAPGAAPKIPSTKVAG